MWYKVSTCIAIFDSTALPSSAAPTEIISAVLGLTKRYHQLDQRARRCRCSRFTEWFSDVFLLFFCRCRNKVLSGWLLSPSQCTGSAPCPHKRPNVPRQCANLHWLGVRLFAQCRPKFYCQQALLISFISAFFPRFGWVWSLHSFSDSSQRSKRSENWGRACSW